jgi:uncharacterized coiled-coil DUF342 family protein
MTAAMDEIQGQMESTLSSVLDMSKLASVFNTLIGVIKDQQAKIDESNSHIQNLYGKLSESNEAIKAAKENQEAAIAAAVEEAVLNGGVLPSGRRGSVLPEKLSELESKLTGDPFSKYIILF